MLRGKTALVTGSTSRIGLGIARAFAEYGTNIILNGFGDAAETSKLRAQISADYGVEARYDGTDMSNPEAIEVMVKKALAEFGAIDILVNNAGIQYASRAKSHLRRQDQIHRLRHVVRELVSRLPENMKDDPDLGKLASYGCATRMHLVKLVAPRLDGDDHSKDIDFTSAGIGARWEAGYAATRRMLERQPWQQGDGFLDGIVVHEEE